MCIMMIKKTSSLNVFLTPGPNTLDNTFQNQHSFYMISEKQNLWGFLVKLGSLELFFALDSSQSVSGWHVAKAA